MANNRRNNQKTVGKEGVPTKKVNDLAMPAATGDGLIVGNADARKVADDFIAAIAAHRHWSREQKSEVPV